MRDLRSINKAVNPNGSRRARKQLAEARKEGVTGTIWVGLHLPGVLIRWRWPAYPRVFSFVSTLPVSGRGGRALNLGNKAAEDP